MLSNLDRLRISKRDGCDYWDINMPDGTEHHVTEMWLVDLGLTIEQYTERLLDQVSSKPRLGRRPDLKFMP